MNDENYSLKAKFLAYVIRCALFLLFFTCKVNIKDKENLLNAAKRGPTLLMLWHNRLVAIGPILLRAYKKLTFCAFISNSRDGEIVAQYTKSYSRGSVIRVPHNAKGEALKLMIARLKLSKDVLVITPDGPKGPLYQVKPGIAIAAKEAGAAIIPFDWQAKSYWELKTWDRMRIPKPFTTIDATFGEPIYLDPDTPLDKDLEHLKSSLSTK